MLVNSKDIEKFKNLSEFEFGDIYYDFHNDFDCTKINVINENLIINFYNSKESNTIMFKFLNIEISKFEFSNLNELSNLTIDNIYRGLYELNGNLIEFNKDGKSYFYIDFYENMEIELWCNAIEVEKK